MRKSTVRSVIVTALAVLCSVSACAATDRVPPTVKVVGTEFRITRPDGTLVAQDALPGTVFSIVDSQNRSTRIRIDGVKANHDPEITLYALSVWDRGEWRNFCTPAPDGTRLAFPLAGVWTSDGRHLPDSRRFEITCTSGAIGKCVRLGYEPWKSVNGVSLWPYHQACVRLLRADYCGNGRATTQDGTLVDLYDRLGIQKPDERQDLAFEAAWGSDGAVCVARTRIEGNVTLAELIEACPLSLAGSAGPMCTEANASAIGKPLLFNRSKP